MADPRDLLSSADRDRRVAVLRAWPAAEIPEDRRRIAGWPASAIRRSTRRRPRLRPARWRSRAIWRAASSCWKATRRAADKVWN